MDQPQWPEKLYAPAGQRVTCKIYEKIRKMKGKYFKKLNTPFQTTRLNAMWNQKLVHPEYSLQPYNKVTGIFNLIMNAS